MPPVKGLKIIEIRSRGRNKICMIYFYGSFLLADLPLLGQCLFNALLQK